jgi:hypothetical protein
MQIVNEVRNTEKKNADRRYCTVRKMQREMHKIC